MSMTTMLTLSSMFSSLTTITPPISYATKLDTWMVMCIVFVFGTLFEFTVVIFLKYYLKYLPYINVDVFSTPTPSGGKTKVLDIKSQVQAWMKVGILLNKLFRKVRFFLRNASKFAKVLEYYIQ